MKLTIRWRRFVFRALFLTTTSLLCPPSIDRAQAQDKTADAAGASIKVADFLDLRGDLPNPRRIDGSELRQLPRSETRTINPHDPGKEIVYSGNSLAEVLKTAGLHLDSGMTGVREAVTMSVIVEGIDGYRAVFALAELNPELTDRVILLADTKDGQPLPPREGPFRIIVPGEKNPGRWVRQVRTITVRKNLKKGLLTTAFDRRKPYEQNSLRGADRMLSRIGEARANQTIEPAGSERPTA